MEQADQQTIAEGRVDTDGAASEPSTSSCPDEAGHHPAGAQQPGALPEAGPGELPPFPSPRQGLQAVGVFIGTQMLLGMLLAFGCLALSRPVAIGPLALAVINMGGFALAVATARQPPSNASLRDILPMAPVRPALLFAVAATVLGVSMLALYLTAFVLRVLPLGGSDARLWGDVTGQTAPLWQPFLLLAVVAPLTEEPIFRGLLLRGLLRRYRPWKAVGISTGVFALMHGNPWQAPAAILLGLFLGWLFVSTGSLLPCIVGHLANNLVPVLIMAIARASSAQGGAHPTGGSSLPPVWLGCLGLAIIGAGIWRLRRRFAAMRQDADVSPAIPAAAVTGGE